MKLYVNQSFPVINLISEILLLFEKQVIDVVHTSGKTYDGTFWLEYSIAVKTEYKEYAVESLSMYIDETEYCFTMYLENEIPIDIPQEQFIEILNKSLEGTNYEFTEREGIYKMGKTRQ